MDALQQAALRQQRIEELCAASVRALTGRTNLAFRGRRLYEGSKRVPVHAPHLQVDLETDDFGSFRGATDSIALRLRHTDPELHASLSPAVPVERLIFELLEQLRVETLAPEQMPGVAHNLTHRFHRWSEQFHHSGLTDTDTGMLIYAIAQICWSRLNGLPVLEQTEDLLEPTRGAMAALLGHDLAGLKKHRLDQAAYAKHALSIASIISESIKTARLERPDQDDDAANDDEHAIFSLLVDFDDSESDGIALAATGESKVLRESVHGYRISTRKYDRVVNAADLVRKDQRRQLRLELDRRIAAQGINIPRLSRLLSALLAIPQRDGWSFAEEEGLVDGRRLTQLVTSPAERRLFRRERYIPHARCLFTVLIDCSGSMKQHITSIAMLVDVLVRALEQVEVTTEILGFTTGAWSGGRAQRDWLRQGRPSHPGRLNELCHMIYKSADTSWRRARPDVAALLKPDLFREGVDGEAVEWAWSRMRPYRAERKILIVISDGSPMDTATNLANDAHYLDNHLTQVVSRIESSGEVGIYGLGVGLDLSPYYSRSLAIDISTALTNHVFFDIIEMLRGHHRR
jgi:cobaltochelatase CobT